MQARFTISPGRITDTLEHLYSLDVTGYETLRKYGVQDLYHELMIPRDLGAGEIYGVHYTEFDKEEPSYNHNSAFVLGSTGSIAHSQRSGIWFLAGGFFSSTCLPRLTSLYIERLGQSRGTHRHAENSSCRN